MNAEERRAAVERCMADPTLRYFLGKKLAEGPRSDPRTDFGDVDRWIDEEQERRTAARASNDHVREMMRSGDIRPESTRMI